MEVSDDFPASWHNLRLDLDTTKFFNSELQLNSNNLISSRLLRKLFSAAFRIAGRQKELSRKQKIRSATETVKSRHDESSTSLKRHLTT